MNFISLYKLAILVSIILLLTMFECGSGEHQKVRIENGTEYMVGYESCLFFTPEVGLMGGEKEGNACLWKTNDGGRNWQINRLKSGTVWDLTEKDGVAYATVETREKDTLLYTHSVYTSSDQGENWQLKCEMVTKESFLNLLVVDDRRMFMVLSRSLLETRNGGKDWQMVRNDDCRKVSIDDKYLYYKISNILFRHGPFDYLVRRSLESGKEQLIRLPKGVCIKKICGDVVFLEKGQHMKFYQIEEDMSLTFLGQLKQQNYGVDYVDYMSRCGNQLFVYLSVGMAVKKLFYSPDGGRHWKHVDKLIICDSPICMLADSTDVRIFISDTPNYMLSYRHKRIFSD